MSKFPGEYNFGDIIKFKLRGYGVVEGETDWSHLVFNVIPPLVLVT